MNIEILFQLVRMKMPFGNEALFITFNKTPFLPKPTKKGKGKIKQSRPHFKVVRKTTKTAS